MAGSLYVKTSNRLCNFKDRVLSGNCNSFPVSIEIHLTNFCNNSCSFCWASKQRFLNKEYLSLKVIKKIIIDLKKRGMISVVLSGGGEPTLHPDFEKIVNFIRDNGIEVGVITNGILLNDSVRRALLRTNWVKFSLHASTPEQYSLIISNVKFGDRIFNRIVGNIRDIICDRKMDTPRVSVGYIVNQINQSDESIYSFMNFAFNDLTVDYVLIQPYVGFDSNLKITRSKESYIELLAKVSKLVEGRKVFTNIGSFVRNIDREREMKCGNCPIIQTGVVAMINFNGDVFPCQPLLRKAYQFENKGGCGFGNLNNGSFMKIWKSNKRMEFLRKQDNNNCVPCRFEKMFEWFNKINDDPDSVEENKSDPNWKFLA